MNSVVNIASDEKLIQEAYERVKADWEALEPDQLLQVNIDLQIAAQTILGTLPEVRELRERLSKLPEFDVVAFDRLEDYVLAMLSVQVRYTMATQPPDDLKELVEESTRLREQLATDATALALRGMFDPRKIAALKGANGYRNVAHDLLALGQELEASFAQIEGKSGVTRDDLKAAVQMGTRLMRVVGVREQSPAAVVSITEERMRAFTQVIKVYEEARAGVEWLRREQGDAEAIAPNLYTGKSTRAKVDKPEPAQPGQPAPVVTTPAPTASVPIAPAPSAVSTASSSQPFLTGQ